MTFSKGFSSSILEHMLGIISKVYYKSNAAGTGGSYTNITERAISDDGSIILSFAMSSGTQITELRLVDKDNNVLATEQVNITKGASENLLYKMKIKIVNVDEQEG